MDTSAPKLQFGFFLLVLVPTLVSSWSWLVIPQIGFFFFFGWCFVFGHAHVTFLHISGIWISLRARYLLHLYTCHIFYTFIPSAARSPPV